MPTIADVAKKTGLSKTTVSRVLNNQAYVSDEKRALVLKAMEELDYSPNPSARRMRGQLTTNIGIIVPRITNPFFSYLVDAMEQAAYEKGYQVLISQSNEDPKKELGFLNLLKTKQVDGIVMAAIENDWSKIKPFTKYGPIVLCNEYINQEDVSTIRLDQFKGAYIGIKHLIERGHRKIAYCTGGLFADEGKDRDRNMGFQKAMKEAGLPVNPDWVFVNRHSIEDGKQVLYSLNKQTNQPTAVFTGSDEVAGGVLSAAAELGIDVPGTLAVIGFDDQPLAELTSPKLTTIKQPVDQLGKQAIHVIIDKLTNANVPVQQLELPIQLLIRQST